MSFDDPYFGKLLEPPLTALTSRPRDIGRLAASHLLAALSDSPPAVRDVRLPVTLVRRRSWTEGGYYATPAVAYRRIYAGVIDGVFSSFDIETGEHRWSRRV